MKKIITCLAVLATVSMLMVSCHSRMYKFEVEAVGDQGTTAVTWAKDEVLATWDDSLRFVYVPVTGIAPDSTYATTQLTKGTKTYGVRRFVYPGALCVDTACVCLSSVQEGTGFPKTMPLYGETQDGKGDVLMKSMCGVVRLHLTTAEKLVSVKVSTADSAKYMAGVFKVDNYPYPVLQPQSKVFQSIECDKLKGMDFAQGADLYLYVAPACYNTFTVTLTTEDGRVCVKNLKEDKYVVVDRNVVCTINLGQNEGDLVFE